MKKAFRKTFPEDANEPVFIPVHDMRDLDPVREASLDDYWNIEAIGSELLNDKGILGTGIKIGVVDSGCRQDLCILLKNFVKGEGDDDLHGHGTHVSSLIKKIAPAGEIYVAKCMGVTGGGSVASLEAGTEWLLGQNVKVINNSFAFSDTTNLKRYKEIVDAGQKAGVIFCCASGNEGASNVSYPSRWSNVFSIGSVGKNLILSSFSNKGEDIDLVAPGEDIIGESTELGKKRTMSGTSQATPHVTGMIALYLDFIKTNPDFQQCFLDITKSSVMDLGVPGKDNAYGYGLIKPYFAGIVPDVPVKKVGWLKKFWKSIFG